MKTEESNIHTRAVFKDENHRLLLKKIWNEELPSAAILMSNAGAQPSIYHMDYTTMFCINSLSALGYGSVSIVNLFSKMTVKLDLKGDLQDLTCAENTEHIVKAAEECKHFIVAIGSVASTYKKVADYQYNLFEKLRQYQDKIYVIADCLGNQNLHPLARSLRGKSWTLVPYKLPQPTPTDKKNAQAEIDKTPTSKTKKNDKKTTPPNS